MGSYLNSKILPQGTFHTNTPKKLKCCSQQVSRGSFHFIKVQYSIGKDDEALFWEAQNIDNSDQKFFIKQINKLKVYNNKRVEAAMNELRIMTTLEHPNLMKCYYAFQDSEYLYLVYDFLEAFTLQQALREHVFSEDQTKYVVTSIVGVLEHLQAIDLAMAELSPKDVFISKEGELKIFNIFNANVIDQYYPQNSVSPPVIYSAPQVIYRDRILAESDYYTLGLIMYEMMTQKKAVKTETFDKQFDRTLIISQNIEVTKDDVPQDWQPQAADFLIKLLIKNPNLRLGRFGSFEVRNHVWLKQFQGYNQAQHIHLIEKYFIKKREEFVTQQFKSSRQQMQFVKTHDFQRIFWGYEFKRNAESILQEEESEILESINTSEVQVQSMAKNDFQNRSNLKLIERNQGRQF